MSWRATAGWALLTALCLLVFCAWLNPANVASWLLLAAFCT